MSVSWQKGYDQTLLTQELIETHKKNSKLFLLQCLYHYFANLNRDSVPPKKN